MLKKLLSVLLVAVIAVSAIAITSISFSAATYQGVELESDKLYFDTNGSGWTVTGYGTDKVSFYVYSITTGDEQIAWGGKKLRGNLVDGTDNLWVYDPAAKGMDLNAGEQYGIIFVSNDGQTYDLLFDTTCLGHVAKCNGAICENPVDSSYTCQLAYWTDLDNTKYGSRLQITSTGNVVGTCIEAGKTSIGVFTDFISVPNYSSYNGKTGLENARQYSPKTEQQMIDDIGEALGLTADYVQYAFTSTDTSTTWSYGSSTLKKTGTTPTQPATQIHPSTPTQGYTQPPTLAPTYPYTQPPTQAPVTQAPTQAPVTQAPTQRPTQPPIQPPTQYPITDDTAVVSLYDINGNRVVSNTYRVGDTFDVAVCLNTSLICTISALKAEQDYTASVLSLNDKYNDDAMFPVTESHTVVTQHDGRIIYNASTPNLDPNGFKFSSDDSALIVTHYTVKAPGYASITNPFITLASADMTMTRIIENGVIKDNRFTMSYALGAPTQVPATQPATQPSTQPYNYDLIGDVDNDGEVTSLDITYIQRWLAEYTIPYPVGENRK